jgi:uncharacterized protein YndB with AHSA1/START domain
MSTTRITQHVKAPRAAVYRALLDAKAVSQWMVPEGMTSEVHTFEAHEGGAFRVSLTYDAPTGIGKTSAHTDTFHGTFVTLLENERIVQRVEFETDKPDMQGEQTITYSLFDAAGGTDVHGLHENLPSGVAPEDNKLGWQMSLRKLAALVEAE